MLRSSLLRRCIELIPACCRTSDLSGLLQATLANAHAGPARRRATAADALEAIMDEIPAGLERDEMMNDWKKVVGKQVRRNRVGRPECEFSAPSLKSWFPS